MSLENSKIELALLPDIIKSVLEDEDNLLARMATIACLIFHSDDNIIWSGFYLYDEIKDELVVGPYMGNMGCLRIPKNKGVCGTAFSNEEILVVNNVDEFPGHISCDSKSKSEIVLPVYQNNKLFGVLDIDFDKYDQVTDTHKKIFKKISNLI